MSPPVPTELEQMLHSFLAGQRQRQRPLPRQRPVRRDWNGVVCFSCGKSGHAATQCLNLDESFPFMQPGWRAEKTTGDLLSSHPGGQWTVGGRKTVADLGGGVCLSGQWSRSAPGSRGVGAVPTVSPRRMMTDDVSRTI